MSAREEGRAIRKEPQRGHVEIVVNNEIFPKSLYRRVGSADVAENVCDESGLSLSEREIFLAGNEKEAVGPFRRHFVKYGGLEHSWHEPLHRHKNGNHWVHARFGE